MTPYYDHAGITIYHGDCREILPQLEPVEIIVTDPPYGLDYNNGDLASLWEKVFGGNLDNLGTRPIANDGEDYALNLFEWLCKEAGSHIIKGDAAAAAVAPSRFLPSRPF